MKNEKQSWWGYESVPMWMLVFLMIASTLMLASVKSEQDHRISALENNNRDIWYRLNNPAIDTTTGAQMNILKGTSWECVEWKNETTSLIWTTMEEQKRVIERNTTIHIPFPEEMGYCFQTPEEPYHIYCTKQVCVKQVLVKRP